MQKRKITAVTYLKYNVLPEGGALLQKGVAHLQPNKVLKCKIISGLV